MLATRALYEPGLKAKVEVGREFRVGGVDFSLCFVFLIRFGKFFFLRFQRGGKPP